MRGLGWLIKDYVETRNGKIQYGTNVYRLVEFAGRAKRVIRLYRNPPIPWEEKTDADGNTYSLYSGRGVHCPHPDKWAGKMPHFVNEHRSYFSVPAKECKACEFHEPAKHYGRKRYASCRWYREHNDMPTPLALLAKSVKQANEMLGGSIA